MKIQSTNISFNSGLTSSFQQEIKSIEINKISKELLKQGIPNDFKDNKLIAWCSLKCVEIINELNKKYNLKLALPKGIFVEDFNVLKTPRKQALGLCNFLPARLHKEKDILTPEKTIFFNEFKACNTKSGNEIWDRVDLMADIDFDTKFSTTDFFLEKFLHEFMHVIHEDYLMNNTRAKTFAEILKINSNPLYLQVFKAQYETLLSSICSYACQNPFEAVACDLSKRIINNINRNDLHVKNDFFEGSPYLDSNKEPVLDFLRKTQAFIKDKIKCLQECFCFELPEEVQSEPFEIYTEKELDKVLGQFWRGKLL